MQSEGERAGRSQIGSTNEASRVDTLTIMTVRSVVNIFLLSVAGAVLLSGCASTGELSVFSSNRTATDELPRSAAGLSDDVDLETSRALWADDAGRQFYAALGTAADVKCVVAVEDGGATANCSTSTPLTLTFDDGTKLSLSTLAPTDDEWTEVATNLWASE